MADGLYKCKETMSHLEKQTFLVKEMAHLTSKISKIKVALRVDTDAGRTLTASIWELASLPFWKHFSCLFQLPETLNSESFSLWVIKWSEQTNEPWSLTSVSKHRK